MIDKIFITKLLVSFFVGGGVIALLSILAKKYQKYGGIILSMPSTMTLGLFFIGWSQGVDIALEANLAIPIGIAIDLVFFTTFVYAAQIGNSKLNSLISANLISVLIWGLLAYFITSQKFNNITYGIIIYIFMVFISFILLSRKRNYENKKVIKKITYFQIFSRVIFSGIIITTAVLLSKIVDPIWGGILSIFPVAFLSSMNMLLYYRGRDFIKSVSQTTPLSSFFFVFYSFMAFIFFRLGIFWGTIICQLITVILMFLSKDIIKRISSK